MNILKRLTINLTRSNFIQKDKLVTKITNK